MEPVVVGNVGNVVAWDEDDASSFLFDRG